MCPETLQLTIQGFWAVERDLRDALCRLRDEDRGVVTVLRLGRLEADDRLPREAETGCTPSGTESSAGGGEHVGGLDVQQWAQERRMRAS